ncbi:hypothetical protein O0I10_009131 [Lichtheimia ornata]|uniref:Monopolin complex subunit Csm1/Pcs1 C-terminal domain-containing protein n=1 Tax=Lichtheimia ornata TaxID=688661 RepID=A0AAD7UX39_9FUNG|nr:uncharacterized protein O0I10_009131 [Lichtheimia ornata]KAJ8655263.1 hypothetical protein O0I10_009131 [Lichtheimia ornata]
MYRGRAAREALKLGAGNDKYANLDDDDDERINHMLFPQATNVRDAPVPPAPPVRAPVVPPPAPPARYGSSHEPISQNEIPSDGEEDRLFLDTYDNTQRTHPSAYASQPISTTKRPGKRQRTAVEQPATQQSTSRRKFDHFQEEAIEDVEEEEEEEYADVPRSMSLKDMYRRINELEKVKQHYDYLVSLRFTEPERIHKAYVAAKSKELRAADECMKRMEGELEQLSRENEELREKIQHSKPNRELVNQVDELNQELATISEEKEVLKKADHEMKQAMEMFKNLSGLTISGVRTIMEGDLYTCEQTGKRGTIRFKLLREKPGNDVRYIPLLDEKKDAQLLSLLPGFLTTEILFQSDKVYAFYSKLRNALDTLKTT